MAIASAIKKGSAVYAYDEKGHQIFCKPVGNDGELLGYTSSTLTVRRRKAAYTYNDKGHQISCKPL